ncbi:MAG: 1,4-dihydroxy-2-naphthoate polyprenyltransferase [Myxococcota bacterium]
MAAVGSAAATAEPSGWRVWWLAARPRTLPLAAAPVAVGCALALARGGFRPLPAAAALLGAVLLQVAANFANDVFDAEHGADGPDRIGPERAVQRGWLTPAEMRAGVVCVLALAAGVGSYLVWVGGWPILALGVLSMLAAVAYTGGPFPLGYRGLGDVAVFGFFGPVAVCGTVWVQTLGVTPIDLLAAVPVGALATAVLVVNNVRDVASDGRAGKRTLVVRWGRRAGVVEYAVLHAVAQLVPLALFVAGSASAWVLVCGVTAPRALSLVRTLARHADGEVLNGCLASTARLGLLHALLFAGGLCA